MTDRDFHFGFGLALSVLADKHRLPSVAASIADAAGVTWDELIASGLDPETDLAALGRKMKPKGKAVRAKPERAEECVRRVLLAALPPGAPASFRRIIQASYVGSGRSRKAVAQVEMFDGLLAVVEVFAAGEALGVTMWGHQWTAMAGGACSLEGDQWVRCDEEGNVLLPLATPSLALPASAIEGGTEP